MSYREHLESLQFAGEMRKPHTHLDAGTKGTKSIEILDDKGRSAGANIYHGDGSNDSHVIVHDPVHIEGVSEA